MSFHSDVKVTANVNDVEIEGLISFYYTSEEKPVLTGSFDGAYQGCRSLVEIETALIFPVIDGYHPKTVEVDLMGDGAWLMTEALESSIKEQAMEFLND